MCHQNVPPPIQAAAVGGERSALLFLKELLLILMLSDKTSVIETAEVTLSKYHITRDIIVFKIYTCIK